MAPARIAGAARAAGILRDSMRASSTSERALARALGVTQPRVHRWCDPTHEQSFTARDVLACERLLPTFATEFARRLLAELAPPPPSRMCASQHLGLIAKELGDLGAVVAAAIADGTVDGSDRERLTRELVELARATARALSDLGERTGR